MGGEPRRDKQVGGPKLLSRSKLVALTAAFCIFVPAAGAFAEEVGGWPGAGIWLVAWGVLTAVAAIVTYQYANPFLPTLCGVMVGVTAPRPSDAWVRQFVGEGWGRALSIGLSIVAIGIGLAIFSAIAKRHQVPAGR